MNQKTILIVDDSAVAMMTHKMILRASGKYIIIEATDGEQAVAMAVAEKPDLILMDVIMPKMTGIQACAELRSIEAAREIPVVLVTTRGEQENVEAGYAAGCNDYITKPVNSSELLRKVESLIG